ncbi:hypothetical protein [Xylophilus rhododendri]|nr:hypothetical protein [Xylophilus rhododendri]
MDQDIGPFGIAMRLMEALQRASGGQDAVAAATTPARVLPTNPPGVSQGGAIGGPMDMVLKKELAELLGLGRMLQGRNRSTQVFSRPGTTTAAPRTTTTTMPAELRRAEAPLDARFREARRWLSLPQTSVLMLERGIQPEAVWTHLRRQVAAARVLLRSRIGGGEALLPLVPSAHTLFSEAFRGAESAGPA